MNTLNFRQIGIIQSLFGSTDGMPIQPCFAGGAKGKVILDEEYAGCLDGLEGFSHIILVYYFHKAPAFLPARKPFLDSEEHGIFAIRHPARPNPIGISAVRLLSVSGNIIEVENIDVLNDTPLIDIKPYIKEFDCIAGAESGWIGKKLAAR